MDNIDEEPEGNSLSLPQVKPVDINAAPPPATPENKELQNQIKKIVASEAQKQPEVPPSPIGADETPKSSKLRLVILIILIPVILAGFLTAGGIVLAYNNYKLFSPPKPLAAFFDSIIVVTPLPKNARIVLAKTIDKMADAETATVENLIEFKAGNNFPIKNASIIITGPQEFKNPKNTKFEADIKVKVASEGIEFSGAGSIKQIENRFYFMISEIPAGSFLPPQNGFKDQWFYVDLEEYDRKYVENKELNEKIKKIFEDFISKSAEWSELSEKDETYELDVTPPKDEIVNLVFDIIKAVEPTTQTKLEDTFDKEKIEKFISDLKDLKLTLTVSKDNYLAQSVYFGVTYEAEVPQAFSRPQISLTPQVKTPLTFSLTTKFSDYDKKVLILVPEGAKDAKVYFQEFLGGYLRKQLPGSTPPSSPSSPLESTPEAEPEADFEGLDELLEGDIPVLGEKNISWLELLVLVFSQKTR